MVYMNNIQCLYPYIRNKHNHSCSFKFTNEVVENEKRKLKMLKVDFKKVSM